jgi:hypothetical protein
MDRRELITAIVGLSLGSVAQAQPTKAKNRVLINYADSGSDEFGKLFRRTIVEGNDLDPVYVRTAVLLPDGSLEVTSYDTVVMGNGKKRLKFTQHKQTVEIKTVIKPHLWCVNCYDANGNIVRRLTSDTFK